MRLSRAHDPGFVQLGSTASANEHIAAGLIWASLCAAVLKRFLAHAAQFVGAKPISTRRVAMCAGNPRRDRKTGRLRARLVVVEERT